MTNNIKYIYFIVDKNMASIINRYLKIYVDKFFSEKTYIKKYFQWSLLEDFDESYSDDKILERENHWKQVFNSRKEGLNDN